MFKLSNDNPNDGASEIELDEAVDIFSDTKKHKNLLKDWKKYLCINLFYWEKYF